MATTTSTTKTGMAGGPPAQLATPIEYATGYALATPRSSFAATEERMLPPTEESALEAHRDAGAAGAV